MLILLLIAVVVFVALPYDAQLAVVGTGRDILSTEAGQAALWGIVAGTLAFLAWTTALWNSFAHLLYREQVDRAKQDYERRRK